METTISLSEASQLVAVNQTKVLENLMSFVDYKS